MDKGAHYYKCDFQVHTPRDEQWDGPECISAADREAFASQLVGACRQKGLQAIAITDHHDLVFFPYIRDAAAGELDKNGKSFPADQRLAIFPGIELTLGIPCQALLILDADFSAGRLSEVLTALSITPSEPTDSKTAKVAKLVHFKGLSELYKRLDELPALKGRYIIFPHVQDGGHQTILRSGFEAHYKSMPCVGGYTDGPASKMGEGSRRIVSGQDANYGNKKIAVIQTSDSRSISFHALGSVPTWIKWAAPTAEALRQACLSDRSRVSLVEPVYPKSRILSVRISDSVFLGEVSLELNSQYNALIGGRGTGKSSLLEYIRWGLCDQPVTVAEEQIGDIPNYAAKRELLIAGTLRAKGAVVTVECELNGVMHSVRRDSKTGKIELKVGESDWSTSNEQEVRDKFPIQGYSQKQLSSVGVIPAEIERLTTAEIAGEVDVIATDLRLLGGTIRQFWTQNQGLITLSAEILREKSQLASEKAQIEALRTQLKGLSPEDQALLNQASVLARQQIALESLLRVYKEFRDKLEAYKADLEDVIAQVPDLKDLPQKDQLESIGMAIAAEVNLLGEAVSAALARTDLNSPGRTAIKLASEAVGKVQKEFKEKYEAAKARSTSHQSSLTELDRLEKSTQVLEKSIEAKNEQIKGLGDPASKLVTGWLQWMELHRKRSGLVKGQCERLLKLSGGAFQARAKACGDPVPMKRALGACFANKNIKKAEEKIDSLTEQIMNSEDPLSEWFKLADEFENLSKLKETKTLSDTPILEKAVLSRTNRESLRDSLLAEQVLDIRLTILEDRPEFEFRIGPDNYIAFAQASSGQQATSLLKVLLNQDGPPLLIDQPEEDLDNEVIQEIATAIWDTKSKRQLLFVSHNANIVVNGDAELVVCFDYMNPAEPVKGHIKCQGAIDIPEVKESIKRVMEGGDKAFELRRQKYGF